MTLVVAGQWRKSGKTTVVCEIIAATREARWTAVKISPDKHPPSAAGDTARYLAAGAAAVHLIDGHPPFQLPAAANLVIESNAVLAQLTPDLAVFVEAEHGDWKPSARDAFEHADFTVRGHATPELLTAVRSALAAS